MCTPWDTGSTLELVLQLHGKEQWVRCRTSFASVILRQQYAAYHYFEATNPIEEHIESVLKGKDFLREVMTQSDEAREEFSELMVKTGAHVTAMVQCLHSMPDILAHALYHALAINRESDALPARRVDARAVLLRLERAPAMKRLRDEFAAVFSGDDFAHIHALANTSKHRSIVRPGLFQARVGPDAGRYRLMLDAVEYESDSYPSTEVKELFPREFTRQSAAVARAGHEVHTLLRARLEGSS
jgi:hypothetical protein